MRNGRVQLFLLLVSLCGSGAAFGQGDPLFTSHEPLELLVEMPMKPLLEDAKDRPEVEGSLRFRDPTAGDVAIDMTMTTRGRSRLDHCYFPPLKINIKRGQADGTVFEGQNKLKIVTHCRNGETYQRYLRQEFGIYRIYNELSDYSFRVRWLTWLMSVALKKRG